MKRAVRYFVGMLVLWSVCFSGIGRGSNQDGQPDRALNVDEPAVKIAQLTGEYDRSLKAYTLNRTLSRFGLAATDLGVSFLHNGRTYFLFGDTFGLRGGDAISYTTDTNPENGLALTFIHDESGVYKPVTIPGVSQGNFEVPMEGVSVGGRMYIYHTTDNNRRIEMGRSVVAVSEDDGYSFTYLYDLSVKHFINVSVAPVKCFDWPGLPESQGAGLMIFGSGDYRKSNVRLAFQPESQIDSRESIRYFVGLDSSGRPLWSSWESDAVELFQDPVVGELSVSYNRFVNRWIMFYNLQGEKILMRSSLHPWGPWSGPKVIFDADSPNGRCEFIHSDWRKRKCDILHDPGRENESGAVYGPYQLREMAMGDKDGATIFFTASTWNPYNVVLMKVKLKVVPGSRTKPN